LFLFFFQAEDGIRDRTVTGVQTCALPILSDPKLELYSGSVKINENDDWAGLGTISTVGAQVGAFALASNTSKDAALYLPATASRSEERRVGKECRSRWLPER